MPLPYGYNPLKEQANIDDLRFKTPIRYIYFSFKAGSNARTIVTLRANQIAYGTFMVVVSEAFGVNNFLEVGTLENSNLITAVPLQFTGTFHHFGGTGSDDILQRTTKSIDIRYSLKGTSTVGRGWGVLQVLDLNLAEGFR